MFLNICFVGFYGFFLKVELYCSLYLLFLSRPQTLVKSLAKNLIKNLVKTLAKVVK